MESQRHGLDFENHLIYHLTGIQKTDYERLIDNGYTSALDLYEGVKSTFNASIKVTSGNGIGCGDIIRFYEHVSSKNFKMIVGCWKQISVDKKIYKEIYEFDFTPSKLDVIFGDVPKNELLDFRNYVCSIPSGKEAQMANRRLWKEKRNQILQRYKLGLIKIDAKIDSKNQRRVQCSLKLNDLIAAGITYHKYVDDYRGLRLPYEQKSEKRHFSRS